MRVSWLIVELPAVWYKISEINRIYPPPSKGVSPTQMGESVESREKSWDKLQIRWH